MDPVTVMASAFQDELEKIAVAREALGFVAKHKKPIGLMVGGAVGYEGLRRANQDRRMGRAMRRQQQQF